VRIHNAQYLKQSIMNKSLNLLNWLVISKKINPDHYFSIFIKQDCIQFIGYDNIVSTVELMQNFDIPAFELRNDLFLCGIVEMEDIKLDFSIFKKH
jgi:hypothetical protein